MAIGIALIGAGLFAQDAHLPAIQAAPTLELKAVYSRSHQSASALAPDLPIDRYADDAAQGLCDLLQRADIQAVVIALPIGTQTPYIRAALSAGKHVLSEKPVAETVADAVALIQWYQANIPEDVTWSVAENWRYFSSLDYAKAQLPRLGRIHQFRTQFYADAKPGCVFWKYCETAWRQNASHQGGLVLDIGVHYTAGMRYLLDADPIVRVAAFTRHNPVQLAPITAVDAVLQTAHGAQGLFQMALTSDLAETGWTVLGERGSIVIRDPTVTSQIDGVEEVHQIPSDGLAVGAEMLAWADALQTGGINDKQRPEEALADLELIELMLRSGAQHGDPMTPQHQKGVV